MWKFFISLMNMLRICLVCEINLGDVYVFFKLVLNINIKCYRYLNSLVF